MVLMPQRCTEMCLTGGNRQVASLNEFRDFFGLKRHETMEDINPNPEIADILRNLYDHPDMVELYPGLFLEEGKPRMDPGCGGFVPPYALFEILLSGVAGAPPIPSGELSSQMRLLSCVPIDFIHWYVSRSLSTASIRCQ